MEILKLLDIGSASLVFFVFGIILIAAGLVGYKIIGGTAEWFSRPMAVLLGIILLGVGMHFYERESGNGPHQPPSSTTTTSIPRSPKTNRRLLERLPFRGDAFSLDVTGRWNVKVGHTFAVHVQSEKNGRLWIFQVDPTDRWDLMFPNRLYPDNSIRSDRRITIPQPGGGWEMVASRPTGKHLLAFVVTSGADISAEEIMSESRLEEIANRLTSATLWNAITHPLYVTE
jgi:hypothetical protein